MQTRIEEEKVLFNPDDVENVMTAFNAANAVKNEELIARLSTQSGSCALELLKKRHLYEKNRSVQLTVEAALEHEYKTTNNQLSLMAYYLVKNEYINLKYAVEDYIQACSKTNNELPVFVLFVKGVTGFQDAMNLDTGGGPEKMRDVFTPAFKRKDPLVQHIIVNGLLNSALEENNEINLECLRNILIESSKQGYANAFITIGEIIKNDLGIKPANQSAELIGVYRLAAEQGSIEGLLLLIKTLCGNLSETLPAAYRLFRRVGDIFYLYEMGDDSFKSIGLEIYQKYLERAEELMDLLDVFLLCIPTDDQDHIQPVRTGRSHVIAIIQLMIGLCAYPYRSEYEEKLHKIKILFDEKVASDLQARPFVIEFLAQEQSFDAFEKIWLPNSIARKEIYAELNKQREDEIKQLEAVLPTSMPTTLIALTQNYATSFPLFANNFRQIFPVQEVSVKPVKSSMLKKGN